MSFEIKTFSDLLGIIFLFFPLFWGVFLAFIQGIREVMFK